jgi:hypothetical protein
VAGDRSVEPHLGLVQAKAAFAEFESLFHRPAQPGREKPEDIVRYARVFDHVRAAALSPRDTVLFMQQALNDPPPRGGQA